MNSGQQISTVNEFRGNIQKMHSQFLAALPSHVTPDKFERVLMNAVQANPDLLQKNRQTLYAACMKAAAIGLLLDGKEAALVAFGTDVQCMPMVGGLMKLARQSGEIATITTNVVHAADIFNHWTDETGEHLEHRPAYLVPDRGPEVLAYAMVITKQGDAYIEVMDRASIEKVRAVSRAGKAGPWAQWWGEMARKTVFRRLSKRLPSSADLDLALAADDDIAGSMVAEMPERTQSRPAALQVVANRAPDEVQAESKGDATAESSEPADGDAF